MAATANKGAFQPVSFILFDLNLKNTNYTYALRAQCADGQNIFS